MSKPLIVKFNNGSYGIRRWSWWAWQYQFMDLQVWSLYWPKDSRWAKDCQGSLAEVLFAYANADDMGAPLGVRK